MANLFGATGAPAYGTALNLPFTVTSGPGASAGRLNIPGVATNQVSRGNSYFGLNSFVSVAAHYNSIAIPGQADSAQGCRELGIGMLVFVRETTTVGTKPTRAMPHYMASEGQNTVELKELTQLNKHLLDAGEHDYETAEEVMAAWRLLGVVKTEAAPTGGVEYGTAAVERILNLIVSHRVSLLNYWIGSEKIVATQKLWILVKRDPNNNNRWQLSAWTSPYSDCPTLKDLTSPKRGNVPASVGAAYYVGRSSDQVFAHFGGSERRRGETKPNLTKSLLAQGMMSSLEISLGV